MNQICGEKKQPFTAYLTSFSNFSSTNNFDFGLKMKAVDKVLTFRSFLEALKAAVSVFVCIIP